MIMSLSLLEALHPVFQRVVCSGWNAFVLDSNSFRRTQIGLGFNPKLPTSIAFQLVESSPGELMVCNILKKTKQHSLLLNCASAEK